MLSNGVTALRDGNRLSLRDSAVLGGGGGGTGAICRTMQLLFFS